MKFAALGRAQWLYDSIRACVAAGHEAVLIGTCQAAPESSVTETDFKKLAVELKSAYFCNSAINRSGYIQMVRDSGAEVAISVNWLTLIGQQMIDQFKYGIVNAHAGDLPRFRGNAVPNWAILAGESKVVLTLHFMTHDLDAGPILRQRAFQLSSTTYIADVYQFMTENIPGMFVEVLDGLAAGTIEPHDQPTAPALSLRCFPRTPSDGEINWTRPADELARLVRATGQPFAGPYSFIGTEKLVIWKAHAEKLPYPYLGIPGQVGERRAQTGEVAVLTGDGVLVLEEVETARAGRQKAADIIKSMRTRLGMDLAAEITRLSARLARLEAQIQQLVEKSEK